MRIREWIAAVLAVAALQAVPGEARAATAWLTDYAKAREQAVAEKKPLLLDFTGSDWCGWCMKLDAEVFDLPAFRNYAKANLILVQLDYPQQKTLPPALKAQNAALASQYGVHGYPCLILESPAGRVLYRQDGYEDGGPAALLAKLSKVSPPAPAEAPARDAFSAFANQPPAPAPNPAPPAP